jgi:hypothetical protein
MGLLDIGCRNNYTSALWYVFFRSRSLRYKPHSLYIIHFSLSGSEIHDYRDFLVQTCSRPQIVSRFQLETCGDYFICILSVSNSCSQDYLINDYKAYKIIATSWLYICLCIEYSNIKIQYRWAKMFKMLPTIIRIPAEIR